MSETATFPLPFDATRQDRDAAKKEFAKYTEVLGEEDRAIKFAGEQIGQTGPVWHFQYTRLYRLPNGFLAAARDIHEGVKVAFAKDAESLAATLADNAVVREFIEDELRYRKIIGQAHATK
jgi:hypothetical protein